MFEVGGFRQLILPPALSLKPNVVGSQEWQELKSIVSVVRVVGSVRSLVPRN